MSVYFKNGNKGIRRIENEGDLNYSIIVTNTSDKIIKSYSKLVFDKAPNVFSNFDCELYKKENNRYERVNKYALSSTYGYYYDSLYVIFGSKVDSAIQHFDVAKKDLLSLQSDTLIFNLLHEINALESGTYKFRIFFRTGASRQPAIKSGKVNLSYIKSAWYYIILPKDLRSSTMILN
jgi:hypothetical protein